MNERYETQVQQIQTLVHANGDIFVLKFRRYIKYFDGINLIQRVCDAFGLQLEGCCNQQLGRALFLLDKEERIILAISCNDYFSESTLVFSNYGNDQDIWSAKDLLAIENSTLRKVVGEIYFGLTEICRESL